MKIFYDKKYVILNKNENRIFYFTNLHKAIMLNYKYFYYLNSLILNKGIIDNDFYNSYKINEDEFTQLLNKLIQKNILFQDKALLLNSYFKNSYNKIINSRRLVKAYIHITQHCNLNCIYCYNKQNLNKNTNELNNNDWVKVIDMLYEKGIREFVFTGGEPLMRKNLIDLLIHIPKDCYVSLLTNGTLLTKNNYNILEYVKSVTISLDSIEPQLNSKNRLNSNQYDILENIKNIPNIYKDKISIRSVISKDNISKINEIKNFVINELNMKFISCGCLPNSCYDYNYFVPFDSDDDYKFDINNLICCGAATAEIAIDSCGNVYPCQSLIKDNFKITNIFKENWYDDIKKSSITLKLKKGINTIKGCNRCAYKYMCGNGCKALQQNIYNEINIKNSFMCNFLETKARRDIINMFERKSKNVL